MIKSIAIFKPQNTDFYEVGQNLMDGEKETDVKVMSIKVFLKRVKIKFSNGQIRIYKGHPISIIK